MKHRKPNRQIHVKQLLATFIVTFAIVFWLAFVFIARIHSSDQAYTGNGESNGETTTEILSHG